MFVMNKRIPRRTFEEFQVTQFKKKLVERSRIAGPGGGGGAKRTGSCPNIKIRPEE